MNYWMKDIGETGKWFGKKFIWVTTSHFIAKKFQTEERLECDSKEIKWVNPTGNQSRIFTGRTDAEAETPILCPPDVKSRLIRKDPDAGKNWRQEETQATEDEMVGWHHWLNGHGFEQTPGDTGGQGSLACFNWWDCKESDAEQH